MLAAHCRIELLGPMEQRLGGAGVVQFARDVHTGAPLALKFYVRRSGYDRVAGLLANPALAPHLRFVHKARPNDWEQQSAGQVLPASVIATRGEPLEAWARRVRPNLPTALNALVQVAERLKELHGAKLVYGSVKPSNVAWFKEEATWGLIDFSCTVKHRARFKNCVIRTDCAAALLAAHAGRRSPGGWHALFCAGWSLVVCREH